MQARNKKRRQQPEQLLQKAVVYWLDVQRRLGRLSYFHVPNGGRRGKREAGILQGMGVRPGVPDLVIMFPAAHVLFIEMKATKGSLSPQQKLFHDELRRFGLNVHICRSLEEVITICSAFMPLNSPTPTQPPTERTTT